MIFAAVLPMLDQPNCCFCSCHLNCHRNSVWSSSYNADFIMLFCSFCKDSLSYIKYAHKSLSNCILFFLFPLQFTHCIQLWVYSALYGAMAGLWDVVKLRKVRQLLLSPCKLFEKDICCEQGMGINAAGRRFTRIFS